MTMFNFVRLSGLVGITGACLYAIGDVLLLAGKVGATNESTAPKIDMSIYPQFRRRARAFDLLARMPWWRLVWGGLLGVFATPLTLVSLWQVYYGLSPAGRWMSLLPTFLFACATVIGPFIHGSFIYLGENVQLLNAVDTTARPLLINVLIRQQTVLTIAYGVIFACVLLASIGFSFAVISGRTLFTPWLAVVNPVTATVAWLAIKKILPNRVADYTEGAGFNIAYLVFFSLTTVTLW